MKQTLNLTGRYYQHVPCDDPRLCEELIELEADKTTLVTMHAWNVACPGGPPYDPAYAVGFAFPFALAEAYRICREVIKTTVDASREAGVLVSHATTTKIAMKRPEARRDHDASQPLQTPLPPDPGVAPGHRRQIIHDRFGDPSKSAYETMDRIDFLMPQGDEPFAYQTTQLHRQLERRGIQNIIYTGFATDRCILRAGGGAIPMAQLGYRIFIIREATLGQEYHDTFEKRLNTRYGIREVEALLGHSIAVDDYLANCQRLAPQHHLPG